MRLRGFCRFYKKLYVGESIKDERLVKWKLKHGAGQLFIYVIAGTEGPGNQLEIMHCAFLKQKYYLRHPKLIYGIAGSKDEAVDLLVKISNDAATCGMDGDLIGYLESAQ